MAPLKPISSRPYTHRSPTSTALKQRRVEFGVVYLRLDAFVQVFWRYRDSKGASIEEHSQYDLRYIHCTLITTSAATTLLFRDVRGCSGDGDYHRVAATKVSMIGCVAKIPMLTPMKVVE